MRPTGSESVPDPAADATPEAAPDAAPDAATDAVPDAAAPPPSVPRRRAKLLALALLAVAALAVALGACRSRPFPYADARLPHRTPQGFVNPAVRNLTAVGLPWYEVLQRRWRGDFTPARPPEGGYEAFAARWRVDLPPQALVQAAGAERPQLAWLGHAGLWLAVGGQRILIDPQLSAYAGPLSFVASRRRVAAPIEAAALPPIDLVLITHNHYDHLDAPTLAPLIARSPQPRFLVPLGLKRWMTEQGATQVEELDWWESRTLGRLTLRFVPAQHWSKRTFWDTNQSLWGGWVIELASAGAAPPWRFMHTGDSGYDPALFRGLRERLGGPVDLLALPVGAYLPRDFMKAQHVNPDDAVQLMQDLQARQALGIHWGTFELTQEAFDDPPRDLAAALAARGLPPGRVWLMRQGEVRAAP